MTTFKPRADAADSFSRTLGLLMSASLGACFAIEMLMRPLHYGIRNYYNVRLLWRRDRVRLATIVGRWLLVAVMLAVPAIPLAPWELVAVQCVPAALTCYLSHLQVRRWRPGLGRRRGPPHLGMFPSCPPCALVLTLAALAPFRVCALSLHDGRAVLTHATPPHAHSTATVRCGRCNRCNCPQHVRHHTVTSRYIMGAALQASDGGPEELRVGEALRPLLRQHGGKQSEAQSALPVLVRDRAVGLTAGMGHKAEMAVYRLRYSKKETQTEVLYRKTRDASYSTVYVLAEVIVLVSTHMYRQSKYPDERDVWLYSTHTPTVLYYQYTVLVVITHQYPVLQYRTSRVVALKLNHWTQPRPRNQRRAYPIHSTPPPVYQFPQRPGLRVPRRPMRLKPRRVVIRRER